MVNCGGNKMSEQQFNSIPFKWLAEPNQLINESVRGFVYRNEEGSKLFIMNNAANSTFIVKLFFDTENTEHFDLVYSNKEVRIFKVRA